MLALNCCISPLSQGGKPLYYDSRGISSFRSYLEHPVEVLPGEIVEMDYEGCVLKRKRFSFRDVFMKENKSLEEIEEEILKDIESLKLGNCCIAFSGGIDSALLAAIHDVPLISVTTSREEEEWVRKTASTLSRDLEVFKIGEKEVKEAVAEVSAVIETSNFLQLSIAIPVHFAMKFAKMNGFDEIIFGQGADELFGGYKRYERYVGIELERVMLEDLEGIGNKNLVRDAKLSYHNGIKLILPYLRWKVIKGSLSIPVDMKVARVGGKVVRKYFLRRIGEKFLPEEIVWREKKAIQYSTGVAKILRKRCFSQTGKDPGC